MAMNIDSFYLSTETPTQENKIFFNKYTKGGHVTLVNSSSFRSSLGCDTIDVLMVDDEIYNEGPRVLLIPYGTKIVDFLNLYCECISDSTPQNLIHIKFNGRPVDSQLTFENAHIYRRSGFFIVRDKSGSTKH